MTKVDETNQEADANLDGQENEDANNANPGGSDENLDDMSKEEVVELYKEYRKNSEKGVQKLSKKLKEKSGDESVEERARAIAKEELDRRYIKTTLNSVNNQLPEAKREDFNKEFEFLTEGRELDSDNVEVYIRKALDLVGGKKPAGIVGMPLGGSMKKESSSKAKIEERKENVKAFVEEMGL